MFSLPIFTVFDTETTGLDPRRGDKIIEIAGVQVKDGKVVEDSAFVQLVNPERDIPWEAKSIHKIDESHVADAPTIDVVLPKFLEYAAGTILVAHNAEFDMGFLEHEKECCWGYVDLPECLCTMRLSRSLFPHEFRHNLDVLTQRLGITVTENRHRALPDVMMTAEALIRMIEKGDIRSIDQLRKLSGAIAAVKN